MALFFSGRWLEDKTVKSVTKNKITVKLINTMVELQVFISTFIKGLIKNILFQNYNLYTSIMCHLHKR
jgi:hypothetical protein